MNFQDSMVNQKFLFIFGKIMMSDIIWILWPIKVFVGLLFWKKNGSCGISKFFLLWKVLEAGKLWCLLNPPCLKTIHKWLFLKIKPWLFKMDKKQYFLLVLHACFCIPIFISVCLEPIKNVLLLKITISMCPKINKKCSFVKLIYIFFISWK